MKSEISDKKFWVYILLTENNTYYCGYTDNVELRFKKHAEGYGAKYTKINKPVKIVWKKCFDTKSAAMKEEYRIKHLTREQKEFLINNFK